MQPTGSASLPSALAELASHACIASAYEDAFGESQASPESTIRTLLEGFGFDVTSEASAAASLDAARSRAWQRLLAPIYVVPAGERPHLELILAADDASRVLRWKITGEDGGTTEGAVVPRELVACEAGAAGGRVFTRYAWAPPVTLAAGYYRLSLEDGRDACGATIAAVPASCYLPETGRGLWGLAAQLHALRSRRNWGIGDFTDLAQLATAVAGAGGDAVGINPLHALRFASEITPSPYSPSSRISLNWIYLDIEELPGFDAGDVRAEELRALREPQLIDYDAVARVKRRVARAAYERFRASDPSAFSEAQESFRTFVRDGGEPLRRATAFEVLAEHFATESASGAAWQNWPAGYRDPASPAVREFARSREREIDFCAFLQWQADVQLGRAAQAARGLAVGLYRDLAVGAELAGADTWTLQGVLKSDVSVGAPPDLLNQRGQNWGVAPFDPLALREAAYEPFIALLRANMKHAGALRIDHVMALTRLFWIPQHVEPRDGAYVTYPLDDLIGIVALESRRARCIVIGEDLGTVPAGLRERLAAANILSYRLLQFESDEERFLPPESYPALALMCTGTHDLPPVGAYWTAHDVDVRAQIGLERGADAAPGEREERANKRAQLLAAWRAIGLPDADAKRFEAAASQPEDRATLADIALWANRYLARAPGLLLMVQLEDLTGEIEQVNIPATTTEHPNWRRRLALDLDTLPSDHRLRRVAESLAAHGRGSGFPPGRET